MVANIHVIKRWDLPPPRKHFYGFLDIIDSVARNIGTIRRIKGLIGEDPEVIDHLETTLFVEMPRLRWIDFPKQSMYEREAFL